ncbi:hypothetical protein [Aminipila sp.]|uniref:hypothetical protein n=1 Tax=Aminipila sp. TaxID=2060095 RepID=UPI002898CE68|nr:hypothetical protein [Aminipila sp.]
MSERAHFMCPNMHFSILVQMNEKYNMGKVCCSLDLLAAAHPFLRSVIACDTDKTRLYYAVSDQSQIEVCEMDSPSTIWNDYGEIGKNDWNVFENGLLKVFLYPDEESFQMLFVAHHLLGDGRSLLSLTCEFANSYASGLNPTFVEEKLIQRIDDLPPDSDLKGISKWMVRRANNQWKNENHRVSFTEYANFVRCFAYENPIANEIAVLDKTGVNHIRKLCKEHSISINDLLMAKLYRVANTKKIIIAADIRSKLPCYQDGSMGNYASAIGIICKDKSDDVFKLAKKVHCQVKLHLDKNRKSMLILACYLNMDPTLIDAAAIASMGNFDSKAAKFVGGKMFGYAKRDSISITNLGNIECKAMQHAVFIPPASPATVQTIGVLTVNGTMHLCSSYYTSAIDRDLVKRQLQMMIC